MKRIFLYILDKFKAMSAKAYRELFNSATSQGSKANVIKPLISTIITMLVGALLSAYYGFEMIMIACLVMAIFGFLGLLVSYFFCLFTNPDYLRSEKYNLEKTAIEKTAMLGDSMVKIIPPTLDYTLIEQKGTNEVK